MQHHIPESTPGGAARSASRTDGPQLQKYARTLPIPKTDFPVAAGSELSYAPRPSTYSTFLNELHDGTHPPSGCEGLQHSAQDMSEAASTY
jgi:hypothetical protein